MAGEIESTLIVPMARDDVEVRSSVSEGRFVINKYSSFPNESSQATFEESRVVLKNIKIEEVSTDTLSSQKLVLSEEEEWNRFILKHFFDSL